MFHFTNQGPLTAFKELGVAKTASLLDIGCGSGRFLRALRSAGYTGPFLGVDPYLAEAATLRDDILLQRRQVTDIQGQFDVITLIHALEHIIDQHEALTAVARLLAPNGICVVSIPVVGGWVWEAFGSDWVQLDPPRHVVLHTPESLGRLARVAQLQVRRIIWDSTAFQFWGSALVLRRRPILPFWRSYLRSAWRLPFDAVRAARLNREGRGDQATFVLSH